MVLGEPPVTPRGGVLVRNRVLVADDTEVVRASMALALRKIGVEVDLATDGLEAWQMASVRLYGLILLDYCMQRLNGLEAARAIRENAIDSGKPCPRLVLMTAASAGELQARVLGLGVETILEKPVRLAELRALIDLPGARPGACVSLRGVAPVRRTREVFVRFRSRCPSSY